MDNQALYDAAIIAVMNVFSDTSVSQETARENLQGIIDYAEMLLGTLPDGE